MNSAPKCLPVLLLLALVPAAPAREIHVSVQTGAAGNPGTREKPLKALWQAMASLQPGDTIRVAEGLYSGQGKSGLLPRITVSSVTLEGGWKADFSVRDPFRFPTVIAAPPDKQGKTGSVLHAETPDGKLTDVTIDGFVIDRGGANYYHGDGEPGAGKSLEGHVKDSCWGFQALNRKMSGSDPAIQAIGRGSFRILNNVVLNCPWWGIYVKGGGEGRILIENNLVLVCQGRGIEAITGGGWGKPAWIICNNTVAFCHAVGSSEGNAISIDARGGYGTYLLKRNVLAFSDGGGVAVRFPVGEGTLALEENTFFFNRRGDFSQGGEALATAGGFEDDLAFPTSGNARKLPGFLAAVAPAWFDRYSMRETVDMLAGACNTWTELQEARTKLGLGHYQIPGYEQSFADYKSLPQKRNNYDMARYPRPMRQGEQCAWAELIQAFPGADAGRGVQPCAGPGGLAEPPK